MKYLYYIVCIVLVLSGAIAYLLRDGSVKTKPALIVNGRVIGEDEFRRKLSSPPYAGKTVVENINSMITTELLIQESRRLGIDREEPFRRSIQNYYEQSLIKILMDRKFSASAPQVSDEEIARYFNLSREKLRYILYAYKSREAARQGTGGVPQTREGWFEDLSQEFQAALLSVKNGENSAPFRHGEKYAVIRLDSPVSSGASGVVDAGLKEKIGGLILQIKKGKMVDDWIAELREKADVRIFAPEAGRTD